MVTHDYVSEGLEVIDLKGAFPHMIRGDTSKITSEFFRKEVPHTWYVTPDFPECGFLSVDEVHILYNNALRFKGKRGLEIGSHVGWSTVHLGVAGVQLDVVEPQLTHDPRVLLQIVESLRLAKVSHTVSLNPGFSPDKVKELATKNKRTWSFFFIDGNHNPGYPLRDAQECAKYAEEDCIMLFHDLVYPAVAEGLKYLKENGWNVKIYHTQQIMGVAWRGNVQPAEHVPDPMVAWNIPDHLLELLE